MCGTPHFLIKHLRCCFIPKGCKGLITEGKTRFRTAGGAQGKDGTVLTEQLGTKLDGGQGRGRPVQVTALLKILSGGSPGGTQGPSISPPSAPHYPSLTLALINSLLVLLQTPRLLPPSTPLYHLGFALHLKCHAWGIYRANRIPVSPVL